LIAISGLAIDYEKRLNFIFHSLMADFFYKKDITVSLFK